MPIFLKAASIIQVQFTVVKPIQKAASEVLNSFRKPLVTV